MSPFKSSHKSWSKTSLIQFFVIKDILCGAFCYFSVTHEEMSFVLDCQICAMFLMVLKCATDAIDVGIEICAFTHLQKRLSCANAQN
jgi:NADH:ubiquinone oxidoreductase subunit K